MASDARARELVAHASKVIVAMQSNPKEDARMERAKASFNSNELAAYMNDGEDRLHRRRELVKLLQSQPWGDKTSRYFMTREQEYVGGLQASIGIW